MHRIKDIYQILYNKNFTFDKLLLPCNIKLNHDLVALQSVVSLHTFYQHKLVKILSLELTNERMTNHGLEVPYENTVTLLHAHLPPSEVKFSYAVASSTNKIFKRPLLYTQKRQRLNYHGRSSKAWVIKYKIN